ncbi:hypothetical protein V499_01120 [Pseudogymnoascus sp. VKM F-103]|nr:hypothetical protein V499_01120 [Pseudogymnoascus sp. VKM F-103]
MNGRTDIRERRPAVQKLTELKEEVISQHIIDLDSRGFAPRLAGVEDMANYLLETRQGRRVGKLWAHRFVRRRPELKTRFNRVYDFQRALCEDPVLIGGWFELAVQPGNREWATAIVCINGEGRSVPPFLVVQGVNHLANWYTESGLPHDWAIKPTSNGWTDNETGLEWLEGPSATVDSIKQFLSSPYVEITQRSS